VYTIYSRNIWTCAVNERRHLELESHTSGRQVRAFWSTTLKYQRDAVMKTSLHCRFCARSESHPETPLAWCWIHSSYMESGFPCVMAGWRVEDMGISALDREKHCWESYCSKHLLTVSFLCLSDTRRVHGRFHHGVLLPKRERERERERFIRDSSYHGEHELLHDTKDNNAIYITSIARYKRQQTIYMY
jgi:hypothetical protein